MSIVVPSATRRSVARDRRGYIGIGVYHPKSSDNIGTLWRSAHAFGADLLFTVGRRYHRQRSDTTIAERHVPLLHFDNFDDFADHAPGGSEIVGVELVEHGRLLDRFTHPERALYILGAEDFGLPGEVLERCARVVTIPSPSAWSMNVSVAGSIVLYDRYLKVEQKETP